MRLGTLGSLVARLPGWFFGRVVNPLTGFYELVARG